MIDTPQIDTLQIDAPQIEVELSIAPESAVEAIDVMHRAFHEYAAKGQTSGAMLENARTLTKEISSGVQVAVARIDGAAVASVKHHDAGDGTRYFGRLGVVPEARGRGVASFLVGALRETARAGGLDGLSCTVRAEEERNIALYERLGMDVVARGERVSRTGAVLKVVEMRDIKV